LADVPDPDSALNFFERLSEQAGEEVFRWFEKQRSLVHYALTVFGYSQYLGETLLHNTDLLPALLREKNLDRSHSREEFREAFARFRSRSFETDMAQLLSRFKRREYIRIVLRDVLGLANLSETTAEISALSDVLIEEALRECDSVLHAKYGSPQHKDKQGRLVTTPFSVLALGKLGGNELNYNSDIDLMFLYGEGESLPDASVTNREYFVRLAQQITDVLSRVTREGFVFRIDLRLRPQGREGESAVSVAQALRYYVETAQDWERQAMIKVRHCAGDTALARQFIRKMQEGVYTEQLNFAAIETALQTRDRIQDRKKAANQQGIDVKLDRGGIRDIEFLVQCLQRVYGGKEKWLRSGGTLFSLQKLHDKQHISGSDFQQLTTSYEFLRKVEHRLQLRRGQQTHRLPTTREELEILAQSLRVETITPENVASIVRERMDDVSAIYDRIVHQQQQQTEQQVSEEFQLRTLDLSFGRVQSDRQILQRLAPDNPELYAIVSRSDLEPHTRRNLFRFLSSAFTSAERYAAVAANPQLVERSLQLFRQSEFLTDILARHPEDITNLADLRQSSARHASAMLFTADDFVRARHSESLEQYLRSDALDYGGKLTLLRRRFRHRMFLSGARDVLESRPLLASFSDNTIAAEEAISAAFAIAGVPGLAVMALGRLGTQEFDCLSDADLLFIRDQDLPVEDAVRAAEQLMHTLSAYTSEGAVLSVDLRLRPHGNDGELTVTPAQLTAYMNDEAQAWEALTYTKLRRIAGDEPVAAAALEASNASLEIFTTSDTFVRDIREMRGKLERSESGDNFKVGPGGLYDIDFLVGYLLVRYGIRTAAGTTRQRLQTLGHAGLIGREDLQILLDGLDVWRALEHVTRLATGRPQRSLPLAESARRSVVELMGSIVSPEIAGDLDGRVASTRTTVRDVFERVLR
jgi:[glutamine synthetase] adenylyltransferase / [glutamine synthetase]-adenylyl-L-tyrosine phosphorylase